MNNTVAMIIVGLPAIAALVLGVALWLSRKGYAAVEREFKNVFEMTSKERKETLLKSWMDRKRCTRREAMRLAIEERRHVR